MDELFPALLVIVIGIISTISKAAKKQQSRAAVEAHRAAAQARTGTAEPASVPQAVAPVMSFGDMPGQVAAPVVKPAPVIVPTVHPHIEPDCDTHDIPGSLGVTSMEGKDPCHENELTLERTFVEPTQAEAGLTFDWSGQNMVKAFVMQEVLTRPVNRAPVGQRRA